MTHIKSNHLSFARIYLQLLIYLKNRDGMRQNDFQRLDYRKEKTKRRDELNQQLQEGTIIPCSHS